MKVCVCVVCVCGGPLFFTLILLTHSLHIIHHYHTPDTHTHTHTHTHTCRHTHRHGQTHTHTHNHTPHYKSNVTQMTVCGAAPVSQLKIGRASCRERVELSGGATR